MSVEYVGSVTLYVDGREIECTKIDVKDSTGRKQVKTMNRTYRVKGFTRGVGEYSVTGSAVIPTDGTAIDWGGISDAKITLVPDVAGAKSESYLGFCTTEVGASYTVDNEAVIDITGFAIRRVIE